MLIVSCLTLFLLECTDLMEFNIDSILPRNHDVKKGPAAVGLWRAGFCHGSLRLSSFDLGC